jgi:23S rRNA pseudouridine2457 synthase
VSRLILFNKPYGVLPQFTDKGTEGSPRPTLSAFINVPNVYPAGRLDMDSEGLMLLTDDGRLQAQIADPRHKMPKSYLVQVEGAVGDDALQKLRSGLKLNDGMICPH